MRRRESGSRFGKGLLIYILVFVLLAAIALSVLFLYLRAYENSRSATVVRRYLDDCVNGELSYAWGSGLAELDRRFQSEEEILSWVRQKLQSASIRELRSENPDEKLYGIFDESGACLEKLTLRQTGKRSWGFTGWEVTQEECTIEAYAESVDLLLPADYTVELNGARVDSSFIVQSGIPYSILTPFDSYTGNLPTLVRYRVGPYLPGQQLRVLDPMGREVPEESRNEQYYLDNAAAADRVRLHDFARQFLNQYLLYAGDLYGAWYNYWYELYAMIVPGGELEERLIDVRGSFGYNNIYSIDIVSDELVLCSDLGSNRYLVDITYRTETVGLEGPVQEDNRARLLLVEQEGQLLVMAMYNY